MNTIKTVDLWTEQNENHIECFSGAFVDGFENGDIPFDTYKVIRNGNCIITSNRNDLNISNKHNAIVFYKNGVPTRLMVINKNTDIDNCIDTALNQSFNSSTLNELFCKLSIKRYDIDLVQQPVHNGSNKKDEIDVGSCDRPSLLNCMLEGCYTQSDTDYGKSNSDSNYHFIPDIFIQYDFATDTEEFKIEHRCAFLNENMTRIIPLQENSLLNIDEISNQFIQDNKGGITMKFYVGSGMKNCKLVNYYAKLLKENGWEQTYDWVKNVSDDISKDDMIKYASLESQGIVDSDVVIILLPAGRGAHIELGMAMALNKKIFLCSATTEEFNIENTVAFYELSKVTQLVGEALDNVKKILELK